GFDARGVLSFGISLPPNMRDASPDAIRAALRAVEAKLASTPGVKGASLSWGAVPFASDDEDLFWMEGQPRPQPTNDMNWASSSAPSFISRTCSFPTRLCASRLPVPVHSCVSMAMATASLQPFAVA